MMLALMILVCLNLKASVDFGHAEKFQQIQAEILNKFSLTNLYQSPNYFTFDVYNSSLSTLSSSVFSEATLSSSGLLPDTYLLAPVVVSQSFFSSLCTDFDTTVLEKAAMAQCPNCAFTDPCAISQPQQEALMYLKSTTINAWTESFTLYAALYTPESQVVTVLDLRVKSMSSTPRIHFQQSLVSDESDLELQVTAGLGIAISIAWLMKDLSSLALIMRRRLVDGSYHIKARAIGGVLYSPKRLAIWFGANIFCYLICISLFAGRLFLVKTDFVSMIAELPLAGDASSVREVVASIAGSMSDQRAWHGLGVIVVYILTAMSVYCLSGHPRFGILTETWVVAADDLFHFGITFLIFYFALSFIAWTAFGGEVAVFRSFQSTLAFLYNLIWSGQWNTSLDPTDDTEGISNNQLLKIFLIFYVTIVKLILLTFLISILVDRYTYVRAQIASRSFSRNALSDLIDSFKTNMLIALKKIPPRPETVSELIHAYARKSVDIWTLKDSGIFDSESLYKFCRNYKKYDFLIPRESVDESWQQVAANLDLLVQSESKAISTTTDMTDSTYWRLLGLEGKIGYIKSLLNKRRQSVLDLS